MGYRVGRPALRLVASWTWSTLVTEVVITGIGGYRSLLILTKGITADQSVIRQMQFSADGGVTYFSTSGDYVNVNSNGNTNQSLLNLNASSTAAARSCLTRVANWNSPLNKIIEQPIMAPSSQALSIMQTTSALNTLKMFLNGAGNISGGTLLVYGE